MKKIFTLCLGLIAVLAVQAQDDFPLQFADKDGNIIVDGTTINLTEVIIDDFGGIMMPTNLYVKNITEQSVQGGGRYTIQSIGNGTFQTCFPTNCIQKSAKGTYDTESGTFDAGILKYMNTEWLPVAEGKAVVDYQLLTFRQNPITKKWMVDGEGPKVTLSFDYNTASVSGVKNDKNVSSVVYYDMQGRYVSKPTHGVYVKKIFYTDGSQSSKKHMVK